MDKNMTRKKLKEKILKKLKVISIVVLVLWITLNSAFAESDPVNQSLDEWTNFTKADNILEMAQEMNIWVSGAIGIVIILLVFVVSFVMSLFFRNDMAKALLFSLFLTTMTSILLYVVKLAPETAVYFTVPLFILSIIFAMVRS